MPLTAGNSDPQDNRTYSFYIWAFDPDESEARSLEQMREDGKFSLEVLGVKASINVPAYLSSATTPAEMTTAITRATASRSLLEVRVRSQDISGPFTIVAWFPEKYRKWQRAQATNATSALVRQEPYYHTNSARPGVPPELLSDTAVTLENPYGKKRDVKVYNGDLRTRIDIVDEREAQASFGTMFSKYFYVGRVYLRNRHPDKRMVVYTTSIRANLLFYRPPVKPEHEQLMLKPNQFTELTNRLEAQSGPIRTNLNETELDSILADAEKQAKNALQDRSDRKPRAQQVAEKGIPMAAENRQTKVSDATKSVLIFWTLLERKVEELDSKAKALKEEARMSVENGDPSISRGTSRSLEHLVDSSSATVTANYIATSNAIFRKITISADRMRMLSLASNVFDKCYESASARQLAHALRENAPRELERIANRPETGEGPASLRERFLNTVADLRSEASGMHRERFNPFAKSKDLLVNPNGRALGFSESSDRQIGLDQVGYLWRDTYRPMTFQAVLNSLIFTHENTYAARTVKILQSVAAVAGGMVGLGTVINEFNSQGYLQGVNILSTLFVPEVSKLILDDLNKHIRNLGEMGMDTVVVVPPNDVVDHYVFFPKGPIYNVVDEFDVKTPAYLKDIDNDDVAVEATLIDQGVTVQGGGMDSGSLTSRALNEGQSENEAVLSKTADMHDKLRKLQLAQFGSDIKALLAGTQQFETNNQKSASRLQAEKKVCEKAHQFKDVFGADFTGLIPSLLLQYGVDCDGSPPSINVADLPKIDILGGVPSQKFTLPVSDLMGLWTLKITNSSSNPDFLPPGNVAVALPGPNTSDPVQFSLLASSDAGRSESVTNQLTFNISNANQLATNIAIPVYIHKPAFEFKGTGGATLEGNHIRVKNQFSKANIEVSFPIYNSDNPDSNGWSFEPADVIQSNQWLIALIPKELSTSKSLQKLRLDLVIDCSLATTNELQFTVSSRYSTNVIATTNLTATFQNQ